jgi:exosortase A
LSRPGGQSVPGWRTAGLLLAGIFIMILVLYRETILYLGDLWSRVGDGPYGHGYLVLAVSLYMIYHRREKVLALVPCPGARALPAVAASMLLWLAATLADIQVGQVISLLPLILAVTWAVTGGRVTRQLLLPVMFTAFALPVWSPLLPVLREITSTGAFFLIRLSGITAFLQGYDVQLPSGRLSIEAACGGLNYLMAALTLGVFYAWLHYRNFRARLVVVVIAAGAAILANILRVTAIIYVAYMTDMQHPLVKHHLMLGWYLFGALVLVLLFIDHMIYRRRMVAADGAATVPAVTPGSANCGYSLVQYSLLLSVVATLVMSGPVIAWWLEHRPVAAHNAMLELPSGQSGWSGPAPLTDSWMPVYHGASELRRDYHKDGARVLLYVGYYPQQSQGRELINELNSIGDSENWQQSGANRPVVSSNGLPVIETELESPGGGRRLVWYFFRVAGHHTTSRYAAKILQVAGLLAGQRGAAVVVLATDSDGDIARVRHVLDDFLKTMEPALVRVADGKPGEQGRDR